jgi:hypothetical protein
LSDLENIINSQSDLSNSQSDISNSQSDISKSQPIVSFYAGNVIGSQYYLCNLYNFDMENNNIKSHIKPINTYNNRYTKIDGSNHLSNTEFNEKNSFKFATINSSYSLCKVDEPDNNNEIYSRNNEINNKHISSIIKNFEIYDRYKSNIIPNKFNEKEYENIINYPSSTKE